MYPRSAEVIVVSRFLLCLGEPKLSKKSGKCLCVAKDRLESSHNRTNILLDSKMLFVQMALTLIHFLHVYRKISEED